jgi:hypothetical protein
VSSWPHVWAQVQQAHTTLVDSLVAMLRRTELRLNGLRQGKPGTLGLVTLDLFRALQLTTVSVDGDDVTHLCISADDRQGWAVLYRLHPRHGMFYAAGVDETVPMALNDRYGEPAVEVRHGVVTFT